MAWECGKCGAKVSAIYLECTKCGAEKTSSGIKDLPIVSYLELFLALIFVLILFGVKGQDIGGMLCFGIFILLIIFVPIVAKSSKSKEASLTNKLNAVAKIDVGLAIYWLHNLTTPTYLHCFVTPNHFVFVDMNTVNEIERIAIKSIKNIVIKEGATTQRLTMTRMSVFGVFALAMPKKDTAYHIVIEYTTNRGNETALFEVSDSIMNTAYNSLKKYLPVTTGGL